MQSIEARVEYKNTFHCAYRIANEEGIRAFWAGALPRLTRLMVRKLSMFNSHRYESIGVLTIYSLAAVWYSPCTRRRWSCSTWSTRRGFTYNTLTSGYFRVLVDKVINKRLSLYSVVRFWPRHTSREGFNIQFLLFVGKDAGRSPVT